MKRKISIKIYVLAFIISTIIFAVGIYVGTTIEKMNLAGIKEEMQMISDKIWNMENLLFSQESVIFCNIYTQELLEINEEREKVSEKVKYLDEKGIMDENLKDKYLLLQIKSYLLHKKIDDICFGNTTFVLYFYSSKNCAICNQQNIELNKVHDTEIAKEKMIAIYDLDCDTRSTIIEVFKIKYNITDYPTFIINDKKLVGFMNMSVLLSEIETSAKQ